MSAFYSANGNYEIIENFSKDNNLQYYSKLYQNLQKNWLMIFPNSNRNAGGVQFFNYIYNNMNLTKKEFDICNKFYCGVSGSVILPENILSKNGAKSFVMIKHIDGGFVCGFYYRCCWPCACDIMNHNLVLAEDINLKLKDGEYKYTVLTIPDPCKKSIVVDNKEVLPNPEDKTKEWGIVSSFKCKNKLTSNSYKTKNNRLVFAVLFNSKKCKLSEYKNSKYFDNSLYQKCQERKDPSSDLKNWGMGDVFIKLAS